MHKIPANSGWAEGEVRSQHGASSTFWGNLLSYVALAASTMFDSSLASFGRSGSAGFISAGGVWVSVTSPVV